MQYIGICFAFIALVSWGFGDFFIQKTARAVGSWKALFFIGFVACIGLLPFVGADLMRVSGSDVLLLSVLGTVVVFAALFDFEALRQGKIAIVEPILGLELPLTIGLSLALAQESLSLIQYICIVGVFLGILFTITTHYTHWHYHKRLFEKGVILAGIGAIGMALTNVLVGISSQDISPLLTIWFAHTLLATVCGTYLVYRGEFQHLVTDVRKNPIPIIAQSLLDNVAWVSFAQATTYIPIAIATTISESYIALAVFLGVFVNRETLRKHQRIGVILTIIGVMLLAYVS